MMLSFSLCSCNLIAKFPVALKLGMAPRFRRYYFCVCNDSAFFLARVNNSIFGSEFLIRIIRRGQTLYNSYIWKSDFFNYRAAWWPARRFAGRCRPRRWVEIWKHPLSFGDSESPATVRSGTFDERPHRGYRKMGKWPIETFNQDRKSERKR